MGVTKASHSDSQDQKLVVPDSAWKRLGHFIYQLWVPPGERFQTNFFHLTVYGNGPHGANEEQREQIAKRIVRAVNSFDALVAACETACKEIVYGPVARQIEAALKLAKGE